MISKLIIRFNDFSLSESLKLVVLANVDSESILISSFSVSFPVFKPFLLQNRRNARFITCHVEPCLKSDNKIADQSHAGKF